MSSTATRPTTDAGLLTSGTLANARTTATPFNTANAIVARGASGEINVGAATFVTDVLNVATFRSTFATGARFTVDSVSGTPNAGFNLSENGVIKWVLATYSGGRFTFYNATANNEALGIDGATNAATFGGVVTAPAFRGAGVCPTGSILPFGGTVAPAGWLLCNGDAVARAGYPDLYAVVGDAYGPGDGYSTFNLPSFADRGPIGPGTYSLGTPIGDWAPSAAVTAGVTYGSDATVVTEFANNPPRSVVCNFIIKV